MSSSCRPIAHRLPLTNPIASFDTNTRGHIGAYTRGHIDTNTRGHIGANIQAHGNAHAGEREQVHLREPLTGRIFVVLLPRLLPRLFLLLFLLPPLFPFLFLPWCAPSSADPVFSPGLQVTGRALTREWPDLGKGAAVVMTEDWPFAYEMWSQTSGEYSTDGIFLNCEGEDYKVGDALEGNTPAIYPSAALARYASHTSLIAVWSEQGNIYINTCTEMASVHFTPTSNHAGAWDQTTRLDDDGTDLSIVPDVAVSRPTSSSSKYIHVVWGNPYPTPGRIYYCRITLSSLHQLTGITEPVCILPTGPVYDAYWPVVAAAGDTVVVLFTVLEGSRAEIYSMRSTDDGATWGGANLVSADDGYDSWLADITADRHGRFHAVWNDARSSSLCEVYADYSDNGAVWHEDQALSICDNRKSQYPAVAAQEDTVYVVWEGHRASYDHYEIEMRHSVDRGLSWEWPERLSDAEDGANALAPAVACQDEGEKVSVVWTHRPDRQQQGNVFYARAPWRTSGTPPWEDHAPGSAGSGWGLQGSGGSLAFSDESMGFSASPSLCLAGLPETGSYAVAESPNLTIDFERPYSIVFYLTYASLAQLFLGAGHAQLLFPSPTSEIYYDAGGGNFLPLADEPYHLADLLPAETWGRFEIDCRPELHHFTLSVNGFTVGSGMFSPDLVFPDFVIMADSPEPGGEALVWTDDYFVYAQTPTAYFADAFDDCDISDWSVAVSGVGARFEPDTEVYHASLCGLAMHSQGDGFAYGRTPQLGLDPELDYAIDFWFMIPSEDNHWFVVVDDGFVHLVIDYGNALKSWDGQTAQLLAHLTPEQWHHLHLAVHPAEFGYDVWIDEALAGHAQFLTTNHRGELRLGDVHGGAYDHGACYWDEIEVTQGGAVSAVASDPAVGLEPDPGQPPWSGEPGGSGGRGGSGWSGGSGGSGWSGGRGGSGCWLAAGQPSPARASICLHYYLPAAGPIRLDVFDVTGAWIATLRDRTEPAGWHEVTWDATGTPAGVYFARLSDGEHSATHRIVIEP